LLDDFDRTFRQRYEGAALGFDYDAVVEMMMPWSVLVRMRLPTP